MDGATTQWDWKIIRAGEFRLDGGSMFGIIPKALWSRWAGADEANRVRLQTNCLLLEDGAGHLVLIETGYGNKFDAKNRSIFALEDRWIGPALAEVGIDCASITDVVLTHLHFDHAGGLTHLMADSSEAVPTFPNATIHCQRREWEDALANRSTMSKTYLRDHLDPVTDQMKFIEGEGEPVPGIVVMPAPGHTWGQQAVMFQDAQGQVVFAGDVMPTANHVGLPANMGYDMEPYTNMCTKRDLLARAAAEGWRLVLDHEPGSAVVRVECVDGVQGGYRLIPATG
ncbi:MAG: MBL fold metallo-hydrolase [Planctomycetes bacterium]|nr:MBL fold metallo-hydrolase [Planctomycetota bacterium]NOG53631.1 MBL fold metallo-hydrolase [Planctomycetota bacterium]